MPRHPLKRVGNVFRRADILAQRTVDHWIQNCKKTPTREGMTRLYRATAASVLVSAGVASLMVRSYVATIAPRQFIQSELRSRSA